MREIKDFPGIEVHVPQLVRRKKPWKPAPTDTHPGGLAGVPGFSTEMAIKIEEAMANTGTTGGIDEETLEAMKARIAEFGVPPSENEE